MSSLVSYTYWKWDAVLSKEFCQSALEQIDWAISDKAGVNYSPLPADPSIRVSDVVWQNTIMLNTNKFFYSVSNIFYKLWEFKPATI